MSFDLDLREQCNQNLGSSRDSFLVLFFYIFCSQTIVGSVL